MSHTENDEEEAQNYLVDPVYTDRLWTHYRIPIMIGIMIGIPTRVGVYTIGSGSMIGQIQGRS